MGTVDTHRSAHEAFNSRNWDNVTQTFAADAEYIDHPRGITLKGAGQILEYLRDGWAASFSDAAATNARYTGTADRSIAQFNGTGTNDGPLGSMQATGRSLNLPFCEVLEYGADGKVTRAELYYDQVSMLVQLGHMPPPQG